MGGDFRLSAEQVDDFHRNGFLGPFDVYDPQDMRASWCRERLKLMDRSNAVYKDDMAVSGATNISNYDRHLDNGFLANHIAHPRIVDRVASILGPDVLCWRTEFFPKYPGDEGTDWHQAGSYAHASGAPQICGPQDGEFDGTLTVWTAFTDADIDHGCLQLIPGTHKTKYYDEMRIMQYDADIINKEEKGNITRGFFGYDYRELQVDPSWKPDEAQAISVQMKAGQAIIFWETLLHASHPHAGTTRNMRLGFASRYVPSNVWIYPNTDWLEEYGGRVSLESYGAVEVSGVNLESKNRIRKHTTTGEPFVQVAATGEGG